MRETIYAALFALLQTAVVPGGFRTCSRKLRTLPELTATEMPALFMAVNNQRTVQKMWFPPKRTFSALVYIYVANPNPATPASTVLNDLLDLLEETVMSPVSLQTLGGLVEYAWIEGTTAVWEGQQGTRAAAVVPINMLLP